MAKPLTSISDDRLPTDSRRKLMALRQARDDSHALLVSLSDRLPELRLTREKAEQYLSGLRNPTPRLVDVPVMVDGRRSFSGQSQIVGLREDHALVVDAKRELDRLRAEVEHTEDLHNIRSAKWKDLAQLIRSLESYLGNLDGIEIGTFTGEVIIPKFKGSLNDAVEAHRRRLRELLADAHRVRSAPRPSSYAKEQIAQWVTLLAGRGQPNLLSLVEQGRLDLISLPELTRPENLFGQTMVAGVVNSVTVAGISRQPNLLAALAWLDKDRLLTRLNAEIDLLADDEHALTDQQRTEQLTEIAADALHVEREEEWLIEQAEAQGQQIARRPTADPRAILGLSSDLPAPT
jgi:hypothetical protein